MQGEQSTADSLGNYAMAGAGGASNLTLSWDPYHITIMPLRCAQIDGRLSKELGAQYF